MREVQRRRQPRKAEAHVVLATMPSAASVHIAPNSIQPQDRRHATSVIGVYVPAMSR